MVKISGMHGANSFFKEKNGKAIPFNPSNAEKEKFKQMSNFLGTVISQTERSVSKTATSGFSTIG